MESSNTLPGKQGALFRSFPRFLPQYFGVIRCNLPPAILRCVMITVFSMILVGTEAAGILRLAKRKSAKRVVFAAAEWQANASPARGYRFDICASLA